MCRNLTRWSVILAVLFLMGGLAGVRAADSPAWGPAVPIAGAMVPAAYPERTLGSKDAKVTLYEYASFTCPHCARWEKNTFEKLKTAYIDTGKVRFIYRDYPLDQLAYSVAVIARCVPENNYFSFVQALFKSQDQWAASDTPMTQVKQMAALVGLSGTAVDACLKNKDLIDQMETIRKQAEEQLQIDSTPSFIVAGYKKSGEISFEVFAKELDAALAAAQ